MSTKELPSWHSLAAHVQDMTLRDYFAAKAMQAMIASGTVPTGIMIDTAKESYEMADAMLKARGS